MNKLHQETILWLSHYMTKNGLIDINYKRIMFLLKDQKKYPIRCYLLDNRYLFGSYIEEAKDLLTSSNSLEVSNC